VDEQTRLGFEFAQQIAIQLITLSTGFLALTITFIKELVKDEEPRGRRWLYWSWGLQLCSIAAGIVVLLGLTGILMPVDPSPAGLSFGLQVRLPAGLQVLSFFGSLAALVMYGWRSLRAQRRPSTVRHE
jgi:hypothetical protein